MRASQPMLAAKRCIFGNDRKAEGVPRKMRCVPRLSDSGVSPRARHTDEQQITTDCGTQRSLGSWILKAVFSW